MISIGEIPVREKPDYKFGYEYRIEFVELLKGIIS